MNCPACGTPMALVERWFSEHSHRWITLAECPRLHYWWRYDGEDWQSCSTNEET